jgi:hypothetical protein
MSFGLSEIVIVPTLQRVNSSGNAPALRDAGASHHKQHSHARETEKVLLNQHKSIFTIYKQLIFI